MPLSLLAPRTADTMLLIARLTIGVVMVYYGWQKLGDTAKAAGEFEGMGFKPGPLWAAAAIAIELLGGVAILAGFLAPLAAAAFGLQMMLGTIWKVTKARKPFPDYSYDLLALALCIVLIVMGAGRFSFDALVWGA